MPQLQRTEQDQLMGSPVIVRFGDKEYPLKPLSMRKSAEWRGRFASEVEMISAHMSADAGMDKFVGGLKFAFLEFPEKLASMVQSYAPHVPHNVIEDDATDEQLAYAFSCVWQLVFPYAPILGMISTMRRATQSL
jgi:hypothetical protein